MKDLQEYEMGEVLSYFDKFDLNSETWISELQIEKIMLEKFLNNTLSKRFYEHKIMSVDHNENTKDIVIGDLEYKTAYYLLIYIEGLLKTKED